MQIDLIGVWGVYEHVHMCDDCATVNSCSGNSAAAGAGSRAISAAPVAGVPVADRLRALGMARLMVYEARGAGKANCPGRQREGESKKLRTSFPS